MSGFSLLEMLVVISAMLLVSAMALPQWTVYLRTYRINNDARSLIGEINLARLRAASIGGRAEVICDTSTSGATALTCGIAIRQLGDATFHGYLPSSIQISNAVMDMPTQIRLTGTDSFGFPPAATSGAGLSGVSGQNGATPFNCSAVVFNSRGLPIFDSLAHISTAGVANTCATIPSTIPADGTRKSNYVMYLQSGQTNYLAVVVDATGNPSLWRWDFGSTTWVLVTD